MTYTAYSFAALSRLRQDNPGSPQKEESSAPRNDAFKLIGSARISQIESMEPWYARLFGRVLDRVAALVVKDRFEFELIFSVNPKHSLDDNAEPFDVRSQPGLRPEAKGTIILAEVFVIPEAKAASQ